MNIKHRLTKMEEYRSATCTCPREAITRDMSAEEAHRLYYQRINCNAHVGPPRETRKYSELSSERAAEVYKQFIEGTLGQ